MDPVLKIAAILMCTLLLFLGMASGWCEDARFVGDHTVEAACAAYSTLDTPLGWSALVCVFVSLSLALKASQR
ncbi:MAG TPA: hypothetical protein VFX59_14430 [Polyangiales bacterium]|nr:hypothetical protein [Polyangiales bacterium]